MRTIKQQTTNRTQHQQNTIPKVINEKENKSPHTRYTPFSPPHFSPIQALHFWYPRLAHSWSPSNLISIEPFNNKPLSICDKLIQSQNTYNTQEGRTGRGRLTNGNWLSTIARQRKAGNRPSVSSGRQQMAKTAQNGKSTTRLRKTVTYFHLSITAKYAQAWIS